MLTRISTFLTMLAVSGFIGVPIALADGRTASSDGAEVYIITPVDAEQVSSPVTIKFGLLCMDVAPAGT